MTTTKPYLRDIHQFLEALYDDIVILDGKGVILWVSDSFVNHYGISQEQIVGKTTYDMEKEKVFYPSVASLVLKSKQRMVVVEHNKQNQRLIVTGIPILDENNEVEMVISYSMDSMYLLDLKNQYERLENLMVRYSSELQELREKQMEIPGIIARSPQMENVLQLAKKVASVEANILVTGESGVGKSLIARMIHQISVRKDGPFIEINCGAIPENLLESELFGYEPGAFTGAERKGKMGMIELAHGGTLFLDEVGDLPTVLQVKLLKVIQDKILIKIGGTQARKVNFRLISATNKDLKQMVQERRFREDLYYRLNVVPIHIPPLRERVADLPHLIVSFLNQANREFNKDCSFTSEGMNHLLSYDWPGNIRQLQNMIERLVIVADEDCIETSNLPEEIRSLAAKTNEAMTAVSLNESLAGEEMRLILETYNRCRTTVGVAKALGISQPSAARKIKKYLQIYSEMNSPQL